MTFDRGFSVKLFVVNINSLHWMKQKMSQMFYILLKNVCYKKIEEIFYEKLLKKVVLQENRKIFFYEKCTKKVLLNLKLKL